MNDNQTKINLLLEKLEILKKRQDVFSLEINNLRTEIIALKNETSIDAKAVEKQIINETKVEIKQAEVKPIEPTVAQPRPQTQTIPKAVIPNKTKTDLEKFIGENLINKIGIAILVIGVGIGAKYSIDHDLISPLTRIILGYLAGLGLLGFGIKLKEKYESYSAVLVSGAIAIMYFITYSAYSFYGLFPQGIAFSLMFVFTIFTVVAALNYNNQVIAHIGLVGAYAVPFLLSNGSGQVGFLFTYMAIINIGILIIAFKKYWKSVYFSSFGLTWLIFFTWYAFNYHTTTHFTLALTFLVVFFFIFYAIFLAYKILKKENFVFSDVLLLTLNSFIFYGIGIAILSDHTTGRELLGLFTLANAVIHFITSVIIYKQKLADRNLFYLASGMVLVFITIAIPVQLDGNWVTLLWAGEAALLFWIGRTKNVSFYETTAYILMVLAFLSLVHDWMSVYDMYSFDYKETHITPLFNIHFLSSMLFVGAFGFITYLNQDKKYLTPQMAQNGLASLASVAVPILLLISLYFAFRLEIASYWNHRFSASHIEVQLEGQRYMSHYSNYDLNKFKTIWIIIYSLFFVSFLAFINVYKIKNKLFGIITTGLIALVIIVFLTQGLYTLGELRDSYLKQPLVEYFQRGTFNVGIRYIAIAFAALALVAFARSLREYLPQKAFKIVFDLFLHTTILWIASNELLTWLELTHSSSKLGLSILWGIYSLLLIALGIWKKMKHLRIGAISLFGITLIKLFTYDISHLDTIAKTAVFVSLGILLLIISFLYNKYKHIISNDSEN